MNPSLMARGLVRNYLFRRIRTGRSLLKKMLLPLLPRNQILELEPGLSIQLDLGMTNHQFVFWFYEEHESALQWAIKTLVPVGGTLVDCGANLGLMGLLAIHHRGAKVLFVEPHPRLAEIIRQDLEINGFTSRAQVCEMAASQAEGSAALHVDLQSDGGHSLNEEMGKVGAPTLTVKTGTLANLLRAQAITHVDFLKIDVEGHELQVLQGLNSFLDPRHIDLLHVEMGKDYEASWKLLTDRGYRAFAAQTIYIDRLRQLERRKDARQFYRAIEQPEDGNLLWCVAGSPYEEFIRHACQIP